MNIYWSLQEQILVPSLNSNVKILRYDFVVRDLLPVVLRVCNQQSNATVPYVVTSIAASSSIKFGAKSLAGFTTEEDFLFNQATWVKAGSGETTTYTANIPLNTAELIAKLGTSDFLDCKAEFTIQTVGNENELSTQVTFRIYPDVIKGTEGVATSTYPVIAQYTDDESVPAVRIVDATGTAVWIGKQGSGYTFCLETGLWYPDIITIVDGEPIKSLGAGVSL